MSVVPALGVALRPEESSDDAFLCDLYATTREQELSVLPWTEQERRAFCDSQSRTQRLAYRGQYPNADFDVLLVGGQPVGRLAVDRSGDGIHVIDIALMPEHRRHGAGTSVLRALLDEAAEDDRSVSLYVALANPARRLYERLGFTVAADAGPSILMTWSPVMTWSPA